MHYGAVYGRLHCRCVHTNKGHERLSITFCSFEITETPATLSIACCWIIVILVEPELVKRF